MIFWSKKSCDLNHSGLLISDHLLHNNRQHKEIKLLLYMFNQFQYLLNNLLLNKQNADDHAGCNAESTLTFIVQFQVQKAPI